MLQCRTCGPPAGVASRALVEAGSFALGIPVNEVYNGASQDGMHGIQENTGDGIRYSSSRGYLAERGLPSRCRCVADRWAGASRPGPAFFEPTILEGVTTQMLAGVGEPFGPVVALHLYATEDEAVALANDTDYGLNASVWAATSTMRSRPAGGSTPAA